MVSLKSIVSMSKKGWIFPILLTFLSLSGTIPATAILPFFGLMEVAIDNLLFGSVVGPALSLVKMVQQLQMEMYIIGHSPRTRVSCGRSWLPFSNPPVILCAWLTAFLFMIHNLMVQRNRLDPEWSHLDWWNALFLVYTRRTVFSSNPLSLRWCPAHKLEHLNDDLIAESMARKYNTARIDLIRNRQADRAAKKALRLTCFPDFNNIRQSRISQWQVWLAKIAALVGETSTKDPTTRPPPFTR